MFTEELVNTKVVRDANNQTVAYFFPGGQWFYFEVRDGNCPQ